MRRTFYWTLALGVLAMAGLKHFEKPDALPAGKDSCVRQCIVGAVLFAWELTAPLAFVLVWFYNGQRARAVRMQKKAFTGSILCT